jgi:YD repeat-containing protein
LKHPFSRGRAQLPKLEYDGLGRTIGQYTGYYTGVGSENFADASQITSENKIFEQAFNVFDDVSNSTSTVRYQRWHNATGNGKLNLPTGSQPKARVSYSAAWQDGVGRTVATANYGTNDDSPLQRPDTPPLSSDTVQVTTDAYNDCGQLSEITDPSGMVTRSEFNNAGKTVRTIQNYVPDEGMCSNVNVTVEQQYDVGGQLHKLIAKNAATGEQVTQYQYGTTLDNSNVARNDLLVAEIYPDSEDSADRVTYAYNRLGQQTCMQDQNGTIHEYDYDKLGRQTQDRIVTVATGVDNTVLRIGRTFDAYGNAEKITSYDNATVGLGSAINEVQQTYNQFGQVQTSKQDPTGAVSAGTPVVQYTYASSGNTIRPTGVTYPSTLRQVTYLYTITDNDLLSRVEEISESSFGSPIVDYTYLGIGTFVEVNYRESDISYSLVSGNSFTNPYGGLDRFGRIVELQWLDHPTPENKLVHLLYGYDRASNRTYRKNEIAPSGFDELCVLSASVHESFRRIC